MTKRIVDFTKVDPTPEETAKSEKKLAAYHAAMPGNAANYLDKKGNPLKCACGQPRMKGTCYCQRCKQAAFAESDAQYKKYERKD